MPPALPYVYSANTTDCPVLCTLLVGHMQQSSGQLHDLQPPLVRVRINSVYSVCQETDRANFVLRLLCLRPNVRCFCMTLLQFMYVSSESVAERPNVADRVYQTAAGMQQSRECSGRRLERLNWCGIVALVVAALFLIALCLGLLKASLGCCRPAIAKWRYDYMQPCRPFGEASMYTTVLAWQEMPIVV